MHCPRGVKEHRCHAHRFQQQALPDAPAVQKAADDGGEPTPTEVGGDTQQRHGVRAMDSSSMMIHGANTARIRFWKPYTAVTK